MSLTAPYDVMTRIISAVNPLTIPTADRLLFVESLRNTYLAFGIINTFAILASLLQINFRAQNKKAEPLPIEDVIA
jgi:hypothetical protein